MSGYILFRLLMSGYILFRLLKSGYILFRLLMSGYILFRLLKSGYISASRCTQSLHHLLSSLILSCSAQHHSHPEAL
ncbi:hypothetical protein M430DRAFT_151194 [Amorphotheca resinae ATCC 22711]|uniref:Uncharacterized protein n=1 Tax=Amorphotheca resinae ATCC 22711 TaxID=857342 RepID=A0A2T3BCT9_AMORE|nr:hypothetical protein M430DRAFT_151194 [Amorphotheca resinae ATCC 22711]PSS27219.1 hypothetical protein M430DRAFT_151194 [Amorphotheca resinae ATCC 22711]